MKLKVFVGLLMGVLGTFSCLWAQKAVPHPVVRVGVGVHAGDTACYRYQYHVYNVDGSDTVCTMALAQNFQIVVKDSSASGYTLEYTLTDVLSKDTVNKDLRALLANHFYTQIKGAPLSFRTDSAGRVVGLKEWHPLAERFKKTCALLLDELYRPQSTPKPSLPRDSIERSLMEFCDTENHIINTLFRPVAGIFAYNNIDLPLGWTREIYTAPEEGRFETRHTLFADTLAPHAMDYDPYGGLLANTRLVEVIPVATVMERRGVEEWGERILSDFVIMPLILRAIENCDAGYVKTTYDRMLSFFFNSWPKELLTTRMARYYSIQKFRPQSSRIEQSYTVWTRLKTVGGDKAN